MLRNSSFNGSCGERYVPLEDTREKNATVMPMLATMDRSMTKMEIGRILSQSCFHGAEKAKVQELLPLPHIRNSQR